MSENNPKPVNPMTTLNGGENFTVTKRDGSTEVLFVKQLPVRKYQQYLEAQRDEAKMIAMACDKAEEYCDALAPESHEALVETIERVNESFFQRWIQRMRSRAEKLVPAEPKKPEAALPTSPPKPPSSAA